MACRRPGGARAYFPADLDDLADFLRRLRHDAPLLRRDWVPTCWCATMAVSTAPWCLPTRP